MGHDASNKLNPDIQQHTQQLSLISKSILYLLDRPVVFWFIKEFRTDLEIVVYSAGAQFVNYC